MEHDGCFIGIATPYLALTPSVSPAEVALDLGHSRILTSFGPSNCVQLWRDRTSGNCFLRSQCGWDDGDGWMENG